MAIILIGLAAILIFGLEGNAKRWAWIVIGLALLVLVLIYFAPAFFNF